MSTKVLILSYFFPPCNLAGANRVYSWFRYLPESGIYPIVITRSWEKPIRMAHDIFQSSGEKTVHIRTNEHEVYYLPYRANLRDRILQKHGDQRWVLTRKALTYTEHFLQNFTVRIHPYANMYDQARRVLQQDPSIRLILPSAMPFSLFAMAYRLHREFHIPWIADYRDDWNTTAWRSNFSEDSFLRGQNTLPERLLFFFDRKSERRWLRTATLFTTVSRYYSWKISNFILRPGKVVYNGYEEFTIADDSAPALHSAPTQPFIISYSGTLYFSQRIDLFAEAIREVVALRPHIPILIRFLGLGYNPQQRERITNLFQEIPVELKITVWLSQQELHRLLRSSHLLLSVANSGIKGVIASKNFAYLTLQKPILMCPSDRDEMEEIMMPSGLVLSANTKDEAVATLLRILDAYQNNRPLVKANYSYIHQFSWRSQTRKLAEIINSVACHVSTAAS